MYIYASVYNLIQEHKEELNVENFFNSTIGVDSSGELYPKRIVESGDSIVLTSNKELSLNALLDAQMPDPSITSYFEERWVQLTNEEYQDYNILKDCPYKHKILEVIASDTSRVILSTEYRK